MNRDDPTSGLADTAEVVFRRLTESWQYGAKGLEFDPVDSETALWIGLRFQTRFDSFAGDLSSPDDLDASPDAGIDLRRGRIKGGGDLFRSWLQIYSEYDFPSDTLLDYRVTVSPTEWLSFRAGQWKSEFSRERIDSSGKQQLVERSISNYWFTVDRQRALAASARLGQGTRADTRIYVEYLSGNGRGGSFDSGRGLWLGRVQWNPSGTQLPYSQSDLLQRESPVPSIAVALISGRSQHTRFSSSGGRDLPGFETGDYDLDQLLFETALHYRGLGWQQEFHVKRITDRTTGVERRISGGYAQLGSFLHEYWPSVAREFELVARFATVDPDRNLPSDRQYETTLGFNWYLNGHRNKITADYAWLDFDDPTGGSSRNRFRVQWELSL